MTKKLFNLFLIIIFFLLVPCANAGTDSSMHEGSENSYANVTYRMGKAILYPPLGEPHFLLPNGLTDVVVDFGREQGVLYLRTFFGNKTIELKSYDQSTFTAVLATGETIKFDNWLPGVDMPFRDQQALERQGSFKDFSFSRLYQLADGSYIGVENLYLKDSQVVEKFFCDNVTQGLIKFNANKEVVWRKTYAWLDEKSLDSAWGQCAHYPGQLFTNGISFIYALPDGTFALFIGPDRMLRVNASDGLPVGPVPRLSIVNSDNVITFQHAIQSRIFKNEWGMRNLPYEQTYYSLQQQFLFLIK